MRAEAVPVKMVADEFRAEPAAAEAPVFALAAADRQVFASGMHSRLEAGPAATLAQRVRDFHARNAGSGPGILVGALPFDRDADDFLFQPEALSGAPWNLHAIGRQGGRGWAIRAEPSRAAYETAVACALERIAESQTDAVPLSKVVLSRSLLLESDFPINVLELASRLSGDPGAVRFLTPLGPDAAGNQRHLVGATPELLVSKTGAAVLSHPLAGSARRSTEAADDRASANGLLQSAKDRREHQWVVEAILDSLAPYCRELSAPATPSLVSTRTMWHLGTRIEGLLKDPETVSAAELAAALHPTPAVGGTPRDRAVALIHELEGYARGFYAGAVGWTDHAGDGAWYVSLRCAEVSGRQARVYAGAGIVEGSDPAQEADETSAKLQAILNALGVNEDGRPQAVPQAPTGAAA